MKSDIEAIVNSLAKLGEKKGFSVIKGSDLTKFTYVKCGIPNIDELGGVRSGGFTVRYGNTGAGKSTIACRYMAWAQKQFPDKAVCVIDSELRFDPEWAVTQGVDLNGLIVLRNLGWMETYLDAFLEIVRTGKISYAVVDSISAMTPKDVMETSKGVERSLEENQVAANAKKIQQFIAMSKEDIFKYNVACEIIAQIRTHGIGGARTYEDFSGGHMIRHMATQIWRGERAGRSDWTFETTKIDGQDVDILKSFKTRWSLVKDTGPNETRKAFIDFVVGTGFDDFECHLRAGIRNSIIGGGSGGRYTYTNSKGEATKVHGWDKLVEVFKDPAEFEYLKKKNLEVYYTVNKDKEDEGVSVEETDE